MDPWSIELIVVRGGAYGPTESRALSRDVERGLASRLRRGVYVGGALDDLEPWERHVLAMRALVAVSSVRPVFSHFSSHLLHGFDPYWHRLAEVHITVPPGRSRSQPGVRAHLLRLDDGDVCEVRGMLTTAVARTVVDVIGATTGGEALAAADAALCAGVPRDLLEAAVAAAGPRRGLADAPAVVAFAHPGAESAAESESRRRMLLMGIAPVRLQVPLFDARGFIGSADAVHEQNGLRKVNEIDGAKKYRGRSLTLADAKQALYAEKLREDRARAVSDGFARWGWRESTDTALLRPVLARIGVLPEAARPTLSDWARVALEARPRRPGRFQALV